MACAHAPHAHACCSRKHLVKSRNICTEFRVYSMHQLYQPSFFLTYEESFFVSLQLRREKNRLRKTEGKRVSITVINFVRFLARFVRSSTRLTLRDTIRLTRHGESRPFPQITNSFTTTIHPVNESGMRALKFDRELRF